MNEGKINSIVKSDLLKKRIVLVILFVIALATILLVLFATLQPQRTVANFCRVAKEEKSVLIGDVNYKKRLEAYEKLESVSPAEIQEDISTIKKGYSSIVDNPSNTLNAGLGMSGAENRRTDYINKNCINF